MTDTLIRGRLLSFHADPEDTEDSHSYLEDGALLIRDGRIAAIGDGPTLARDHCAPKWHQNGSFLLSAETALHYVRLIADELGRTQ